MEQRKAHGHSTTTKVGAEASKQTSCGGLSHPHRMQQRRDEEEDEDEDELDEEDFLDSDGEMDPEMIRHMRMLQAQENSSDLGDEEVN